MDKYLKKADLSGISDASVAHTTFDLTAWANNLSSSHRNHRAGYLEDQASSSLEVDSETKQKTTSTKTEEKDRREVTLNNNVSTIALANPLSPGRKSDIKRSLIPHPSSSARMSVGAEQSSTLKCPADKVGAFNNSVSTATRTITENGIKPGALKPRASNTISSSLETSQNSDKSTTASSGLPRTPPGSRQGQSDLSRFKGSPPQGVKSAGQQQPERPKSYPEKKPPLNTITAPLPSSSAEKHVGFSQPPPDPTSGE